MVREIDHIFLLRMVSMENELAGIKILHREISLQNVPLRLCTFGKIIEQTLDTLHT